MPNTTPTELGLYTLLLAVVIGAPTFILISINPGWWPLAPIAGAIITPLVLVPVISAGVRHGMRWAHYDQQQLRR